VILDRRTSTYRTMSFVEWERRIAEGTTSADSSLADPGSAVAADSAEAPAAGDASGPETKAPVPVPAALRFELEGEGGQIAGLACTRYHLFTRHEVFPGEFERVEAEIWVTGQLPLPGTAIDTYRRVLASFDRVDLGAAAERPPGIVLRSCVRHLPENPGSPIEVETSEVLAVERRDLAAAEFAIPDGFVPAEPAVH
jgi:hypothetical protein